MTIDQNDKWFETTFIGNYSILDFARTGIAVVFIMMCLMFLTYYIINTVKKTSEGKVVIEYVNVQQDDILGPEGNLILAAPDLIIDKVIDFPVSYGHTDVVGYILRDKITNVRYMYVRYGGAHGAIGLTRYIEKKENGR